MITEFESIRISLISSFIVWYVIRQWRRYSTCKGYEIKEFILRRDNEKYIKGDFIINSSIMRERSDDKL